MRRNPYLVEFEAQRSQGRGRSRSGQTFDSRQASRRGGYKAERGAEYDAGPRGGQRHRAEKTDMIWRESGRRREEETDFRQRSPKRRGDDAYAGRRQYGQDMRAAVPRSARGPYIEDQTAAEPRKRADGRRIQAPLRQSAGPGAMTRRRRRVMMQRALVGVWVFCVLVLVATLLLEKGRASAGGDTGGLPKENTETGQPQYSGYMVQGLPAEEFAKHPEWTEDFLTVNEYSRPGDPLESVKNIFVHYTANPGTSAAQNRSYFEGLKDSHETSASSHFIIGYEGEIIQCVPLDEIAYAVQSRNGDSVSIECCYLEADGSFTQETYDSLLLLLAWLTDVYDLDTEDILRHYDCGGKKCPLYYTDNPDKWEDLKKDVDKL